MVSERLQSYIIGLNDARVSLHMFILGVLLLPIELFGTCLFHLPLKIDSLEAFLYRFGLITVYITVIVAVCSFILPLKRYPDYQAIGSRALALGFVVSLGGVLALGTVYWRFGCYMMVLAIFHWSEYYVTAVINPTVVTLDSYLLDHSVEYGIAAVVSWLEFWVEEVLLFPTEWNWLPWISLVGLFLCLVGEVLRKGAMLTARSNFNHYVQHSRQRDHVLVRHGVFAWFRHPSYVGWFLWCIGTQLVLVNPVCCVLYIAATWNFFNTRIIEEEQALISFFGESYLDYQREVGTGLPFIYGYQPV